MKRSIYFFFKRWLQRQSSPTLLTSAAKDKNEMFSQISRCNCTTRMKRYVKTGPYAFLQNLSKQRFGVIRNSTHSLLEWTYFSKLLFSARDPRSMPSCFFFFFPVSTLRLFRSRVGTLWRHSRQQVCDRAPLYQNDMTTQLTDPLNRWTAPAINILH